MTVGSAAAVAAAAASQAAASTTLSTSGKLFFGSLCGGTFTLGCWQVQRLYDKLNLIQNRQDEIQQVPSTKVYPGTFRRIQVRGTYDHSKEFLVGPRSSPNGGSGGGTVSGASQQGYYVVTPMIVQEDGGASLSSSSSRILLVNRGWVPRTMVDGDPRMSRRQQQRQQELAETKDDTDAVKKWIRPQGLTSVLAVPTPPEQPRFLVAQHELSKRPIQLYWYDLSTMQQLIHPGAQLVTAISDDDDVAANKQQSQLQSYPQVTSLDSLASFKVNPAIHAAYAVTWFGLSLAGVIMTRKLIRGTPPPPPKLSSSVVGK